MTKFPVSCRSRANFSAQEAREDLMAEAYTREVEVGLLHPQF
jgi:hypothetical protein